MKKAKGTTTYRNQTPGSSK